MTLMNVTRPPSNIPVLLAATGEFVPADFIHRVVASSARSNWHNLVVEELHVPIRELDEHMFVQHVVAVNVGPRLTFEVTKDGRRLYVLDTGSISFIPSHQPFFTRRKRDESGPAHVILVALDPGFVSRTAASLELDPNDVELIERRSRSDPILRHTVMALHAGLRAGRTSDQMYGESLSTALAVHVLREYGGVAMRPQPTSGRLPREKLMRAFEFIQDQLEANLTVAGIARAVRMSPYHFTRLFKQSTGLSPYRYVIQARVKKAKELLTSENFSIIEIAHRLGFADQSHLTRHFKNIFGVTPKKLQEWRDLEQDPSKDLQKHSREPLT
jgi:AraC family transcriptional regulator